MRRRAPLALLFALLAGRAAAATPYDWQLPPGFPQPAVPADNPMSATKVALGHHRDDIVETLFLNMFYGGRMKAMPPKLLSDDGKHVVIRPLAYCAERDIARYARGRGFPIIPCKLCGSQDNMKRREVKAMLAKWEQEDPGRSDRLFRSLQNVTASHLADTRLYDFASLQGSKGSDPAGG